MNCHEIIKVFHIKRHEYIMKYGENPNLCFISKNFLDRLKKEYTFLNQLSVEDKSNEKQSIYGCSFLTVLENNQIFFTQTPQ